MEDVERQLVALIREAFPFAESAKGDASAPAEFSDETWRALADAAGRNALTVLLFDAIEKLERNDVPRGVRDSLQNLYRSSVLSQGMMYRELDCVADKFAEQSIPLVILKGAALAKLYYAVPAERPFGDLDLLVHAEDAPRVRENLLARGMKEFGGVARGLNQTYYGEASFNSADGRGAQIDVHWELVSPAYYRRRMEMDWFWRNTEPCELGGHTLQALNPTAQLVHLAIHAGLHHQDRLRLIWLYDLALGVSKHGTEIDWRGADAFASRSGLARPMRAMFERMHESWGVVLPREAQQLFQPPRWDIAERTVYALTTTRFTEARTLSDALNMPGARRKFEFVRKYLFPDSSYMRRRYQIKNDALLPLYYVRRLAESAFKFTRSLWAAARGLP